jgi:hypothetical protein
MAGAFAQGFQLGGSLYNDAERMRMAEREFALRQAAEERAAQTFEFQKLEFADRERERRERAQTGLLYQQAAMPIGKAGTGEDVGNVVGRFSDFSDEGRAQLTEALNKLSPEQAQQALRAYRQYYSPDQSAPLLARAFELDTGGVEYTAPSNRAPALASQSDLANAYAYRDEQGGLRVTPESTKRTPEETLARFQQLAAESGNLPAIDRAQTMRLADIQTRTGEQGLRKGAVELENLLADKDFNDRYRKYVTEFQNNTGRLFQELETTAANEGPKGVLEKYGTAYAKATGNRASLVGNNVEVKGSDGKVVETFPATELLKKIEPLFALQRAEQFRDGMVANGMFKTPKDAMDFVNTERTYRQQQQQLDISRYTAQSGRMSAEAAQTSAAAAQTSALANLQNVTDQAGTRAAVAGYYNELAEKFKSQSAADRASVAAAAPFIEQFNSLSLAEQRGEKGLELMLSATAASALKSADYAKVVQTLAKPPKAAVTNADVANFIKQMENASSGMTDPKTGQDIPFNRLHPSLQAQIAVAALSGAAAPGARPDFKPGSPPRSAIPPPPPPTNASLAAAGLSQDRAAAITADSSASRMEAVDAAIGADMQIALRKNLSGLTPDVISRLRPEEAAGVLRENRGSLSPEQVRLLGIQGLSPEQMRLLGNHHQFMR